MAKRTSVPVGKQRIRVDRGIYLKQSGQYLVQWRDPGRKQHWREFGSLNEARQHRARILLDPRSGMTGKRKLEEVWADLLEHHGGGLRPTTRANWKQEWRAHIAPMLGDWPIGKITVRVVKDFLSDLEGAGVGAATRQKCRAILGRILAEAVENQEIGWNPVAVRGTRVKQPQAKKARILTPPEVERVIESAGRVASPSDALAIETMFALGLRIGEMAGLQIRDVDTARHEITVQRTVIDTGGQIQVQDATKTNQARGLPLSADWPLWAKLVKHIRESNRIAQAPLFASSTGGVIRPNNWRRRVWNRAMQEAGILDPPTPHSARRTTASLLSERAVPPATIRAILGHSTLQQTGEYIDVPRELMRAGLAKVAGPVDA